jgi:hypothetical protein
MASALFAPTGRGKVRCATCGRSGYPDAPWQVTCRAGHPCVCPCGRTFATKSGLSAHWRHRPTHQEWVLDVQHPQPKEYPQ